MVSMRYGFKIVTLTSWSLAVKRACFVFVREHDDLSKQSEGMVKSKELTCDDVFSRSRASVISPFS